MDRLAHSVFIPASVEGYQAFEASALMLQIRVFTFREELV